MRISDWSSDVCSSDLGNGVEHLDVAGAGGVAPALDQIELLQRQAWLITTRVLLCPDDDVRRLRAVRPGRQIATHHCTSQLTGVDRIVAGRQSIADIGGGGWAACERADSGARPRGGGGPQGRATVRNHVTYADTVSPH